MTDYHSFETLIDLSTTNVSEPIQEEDEHFQKITRDNLKSIDQIEYKYNNNYYHNLDRLLGDYEALICNTIQRRCRNVLSKIYLTNLLLHAQKIITSKKKDFYEKWNIYYNIKLANNQVQNGLVGGGDPNVWYKKFDESTKRQYFEIDDYKIQVPGFKEGEDAPPMTEKQKREAERIKEIMLTTKTSRCAGECCTVDPPENNSTELKNRGLVMLSECDCAKTKVECGDECGCDPDQCRNRQMSMS